MAIRISCPCSRHVKRQGKVRLIQAASQGSFIPSLTHLPIRSNTHWTHYSPLLVPSHTPYRLKHDSSCKPRILPANSFPPSFAPAHTGPIRPCWSLSLNHDTRLIQAASQGSCLIHSLTHSPSTHSPIRSSTHWTIRPSLVPSHTSYSLKHDRR